MKIDKDLVESVLCDYPTIDSKTRFEIMAKLEKEVEESKPEREKLPKKEFVAVAVTEDEKFSETPLFIVQIEEGEDHSLIVEKITTATAKHNNTKKGQKNPILTLGDAMSGTKRSLITDEKVWVKSKEPVIIVSTPKNELVFSK